MGTYELDDGLVQQFLNGDLTHAQRMRLVKSLQAQWPIQVAKGLGAVARLENGWVVVRGDISDTPWRCLSGDGRQFEGWYSTADLPFPITEELSPGVEL